MGMYYKRGFNALAFIALTLIIASVFSISSAQHHSNLVYTTKGQHNIDKNSNDIQKEIRLVPEMINLLGCNKDNFKKLLGKMNYKTYLKNNDIYFKYMPYKQNIKKTNNYKKDKNYADSPFEKLVQLNIK